MSPWLLKWYRWLLGFAVLIGTAVGTYLAWGAPTMTLSIPVGVHRTLIVTAAYRTILADPPDGPGHTIHEVRLRIGRENRQHDTYAQLLDLTVPPWPWWSALLSGVRTPAAISFPAQAVGTSYRKGAGWAHDPDTIHGSRVTRV
jgi:hypothetical protein